MEEQLKQLFRANRQGITTHASCANEVQLAALVDGRLEQKSRARLESHLADCESCLAQLSFLIRESEATMGAGVPQHLLTKAKKLVVDRKRGFSLDWRWATALGAACLLIVGIIAIGIRLRMSGASPTAGGSGLAQQHSPNPEVTPQTENSPPNSDIVARASSPAIPKPTGAKPELPPAVVRSAQPPAGLPNLLFPQDGAVVKRDSLSFRWHPVSEADFYDVTIMTASGDVLISRQVKGELMNAPADLQIQTGAKYFVSIRAHMRNGKTVRSNVVSFKVQ